MRGASRGAPAALVTLDNLEPIAGPRGGDVSFECLPYQLSMLDLGIELTVRREASYRLSQPLPLGAPSMLLAECPAGSEAFTLKKLECSKQARSPEYRS
ncbi:uncharacterized protein AKAME5_002623400 [Lates japonicus]|uniref:Uncharacterized protein n=1 Tax=Lates japonicus TaxID=270547 RepID=A0AAD3NGL0_LATJO|nr:uncharacterized protein AKAME5_002727300 [Lates japonicus]GLD52517.1 uncharacterized protein AKAME5_002823200 [Lates japonicus]GLD55499.1 uncharacterized protein AKAME5_002854500 [Lates japonicus]GLD72628.1 uncharacterized protein AKAME5_002395300 [Lates japonicus]GLD72804.1 uncharacterized protein AKAME5_002412900 [Lates japonicus]